MHKKFLAPSESGNSEDLRKRLSSRTEIAQISLSGQVSIKYASVHGNIMEDELRQIIKSELRTSQRFAQASYDFESSEAIKSRQNENESEGAYKVIQSHDLKMSVDKKEKESKVVHKMNPENGRIARSSDETCRWKWKAWKKYSKKEIMIIESYVEKTFPVVFINAAFGKPADKLPDGTSHYVTLWSSHTNGRCCKFKRAKRKICEIKLETDKSKQMCDFSEERFVLCKGKERFLYFFSSKLKLNETLFYEPSFVLGIVTQVELQKKYIFKTNYLFSAGKPTTCNCLDEAITNSLMLNYRKEMPPKQLKYKSEKGKPNTAMEVDERLSDSSSVSSNKSWKLICQEQVPSGSPKRRRPADPREGADGVHNGKLTSKIRDFNYTIFCVVCCVEEAGFSGAMGQQIDEEIENISVSLKDQELGGKSPYENIFPIQTEEELLKTESEDERMSVDHEQPDGSSTPQVNQTEGLQITAAEKEIESARRSEEIKLALAGFKYVEMQKEKVLLNQSPKGVETPPQTNAIMQTPLGAPLASKNIQNPAVETPILPNKTPPMNMRATAFNNESPSGQNNSLNQTRTNASNMSSNLQDVTNFSQQTNFEENNEVKLMIFPARYPHDVIDDKIHDAIEKMLCESFRDYKANSADLQVRAAKLVHHSGWTIAFCRNSASARWIRYALSFENWLANHGIELVIRAEGARDIPEMVAGFTLWIPDETVDFYTALKDINDENDLPFDISRWRMVKTIKEKGEKVTGKKFGFLGDDELKEMVQASKFKQLNYKYDFGKRGAIIRSAGDFKSGGPRAGKRAEVPSEIYWNCRVTNKFIFKVTPIEKRSESRSWQSEPRGRENLLKCCKSGRMKEMISADLLPRSGSLRKEPQKELNVTRACLKNLHELSLQYCCAICTVPENRANEFIKIKRQKSHENLMKSLRISEENFQNLCATLKDEKNERSFCAIHSKMEREIRISFINSFCSFLRITYKKNEPQKLNKNRKNSKLLLQYRSEVLFKKDGKDLRNSFLYDDKALGATTLDSNFNLLTVGYKICGWSSNENG